tara:strand:- start:380 stop:490 length:111 start_codon:yes stop_codon:yes gene_type:complete
MNKKEEQQHKPQFTKHRKNKGQFKRKQISNKKKGKI